MVDYSLPRVVAVRHVREHVLGGVDDVHAEYSGYEITITIRDGVVTGKFPGRALRLVLEWRDQHERELMGNWDRLRAGQAPLPIPPLD